MREIPAPDGANSIANRSVDGSSDPRTAGVVIGAPDKRAISFDAGGTTVGASAESAGVAATAATGATAVTGATGVAGVAATGAACGAGVVVVAGVACVAAVEKSLLRAGPFP